MTDQTKDLSQEFTWHTFDVNSFLPKGWVEQVTAFALEVSELRELRPTSVTSRESTRDISIPILTIDGAKVREGLRWLFDLYRGTFRDIAQTCVAEPLLIGTNVLHAVVINVQRGTNMRYECHVDTNPLSGLLYVTSHGPSDGGELVVANRADAVGVEGISRDCKLIYPESGKLIIFDARDHPHFVRPLSDQFGVRVVVVMNFYTSSCPESSMPTDLTLHMFGKV